MLLEGTDMVHVRFSLQMATVATWDRGPGAGAIGAAIKMERTMFLKTVATALALSVGAMTYSAPAQANANDAVIAGAAGFAVGTLFGSAAYHRGYYAPRRYYAPRAYYRPYYHPRAYYAPRRAYYRSWYGYPVHRCLNRDTCY